MVLPFFAPKVYSTETFVLSITQKKNYVPAESDVGALYSEQHSCVPQSKRFSLIPKLYILLITYLSIASGQLYDN